MTLYCTIQQSMYLHYFLTKTFEHVNNFVISCCLILYNIWTLPLQHFGKTILSFVITVVRSKIFLMLFSRLIVTFSYLLLKSHTFLFIPCFNFLTLLSHFSLSNDLHNPVCHARGILKILTKM